jgi:D-alanyl-D-alanine carboxypeptidase/D-alanyl-D-alanine-endopeptidase (penicillin-binding protein 4)
MKQIYTLLTVLLITISLSAQQSPLDKFLGDSTLLHSSVSLIVADQTTGKAITEFNSSKSLIPASVMKLVTTAVALEILGPDYTFKTRIGYTGSINRRSGKLTGDIIIQGGGDPCLGSKYFPQYYDGFINKWIDEIKKLGIKKIDGRIITDDSYFDFQPIPGKWLWEDAGNYYGAGVYGLSVFDNTYEIHFNTASDTLHPAIQYIVPAEIKTQLSNRLTASGTTDKGYVYSAPYSNTGWLEGSIPAGKADFVLKASISDPPLLLATIITSGIEKEGINVSGEPTTVRLELNSISSEIFPVTETSSPPLSSIIEVLNHESVNLYAETLVKEMGKKLKNSGTTNAGVEVIKEFLEKSGINPAGMFIDDGSGLSTLNAINAREHANLLIYMKNKSMYSGLYYNSLPEAGVEGTLKYYFRDPVFASNLRAKSGSMTRVRSYAGYFTASSGKKMVFSIIINNYTGTSRYMIGLIEIFLKDIILNN